MASFFNALSDHLYHYIDFVWLPVAIFTVHKHQRLVAFSFVVFCLMTLRIQVELMESTGYTHGFLSLMHSHVFPRGMIVYSLIIVLYMVLAYLSPKTQKVIFFAASLSIYVLAFCLSMLVMTL